MSTKHQKAQGRDEERYEGRDGTRTTAAKERALIRKNGQKMKQLSAA